MIFRKKPVFGENSLKFWVAGDERGGAKWGMDGNDTSDMRDERDGRRAACKTPGEVGGRASVRAVFAAWAFLLAARTEPRPLG